MKTSLMFFKLNIFLILLFLTSHTMAYDEPPFNVVQKTDVYEIRFYENRLVVQAAHTNQDRGFRKLFNYISGANINSEKIKMTIPVTEFNDSSGMIMQFYLPLKFTEKTAPAPTDPKVELITIVAGYYAVIKFSGRLTDKNFDRHNKILKENLTKDGIKIIGPALKAIYNGPFTLPFLRRNESMFHVDWNKN